ncbi:MAG: glycosyltransferase [Nitrospirota bacterium]
MTGSNKINLMALIVSMPVGGVETQLLSVLSRLDRDRYSVSICCIKEAGALGEKAAKEGMKVIPLGLMKSSRFSPVIACRISKAIQEQNVHLLWTHQYVANLYGRLAVLKRDMPAVVSNFHALYDNPKIHRRFFNRLLSARTDAMVAVSQAVAADVRRYDGVRAEKVRIIHNGIDLSVFNIAESKAECRRKLGLPEDAVIVGSVGRLSNEKNHKLIIEAVRRLPEDFKGLIIGDGPLRKTLEEEGGGKFYFPGQMEYNQIPFALRAMDVFCSPSLWEGFGISLVEAMAAGLPVVASDLPTHREIMEEAGALVPLGDAEGLADMLKRITGDPALRAEFGRKSQERAGAFSIDETVASYEKVFEEAVRKRTRYEKI